MLTNFVFCHFLLFFFPLRRHLCYFIVPHCVARLHNRRFTRQNTQRNGPGVKNYCNVKQLPEIAQEEMLWRCVCPYYHHYFHYIFILAGDLRLKTKLPHITLQDSGWASHTLTQTDWEWYAVSEKAKSTRFWQVFPPPCVHSSPSHSFSQRQPYIPLSSHPFLLDIFPRPPFFADWLLFFPTGQSQTT